jgi:Undecaprenyl-phosphate galactose phosphotransferase WbaP
MSSVLVCSDLFSLILSGWCAYHIRDLVSPGLNLSLYLRYVPLMSIFAVVYAWRGLYPTIGLGAVEELRRLTITTSLVFVCIAALAFSVHSPYTYSRFTFFATWLLALAFVPFGRAAARALLTRWQLWGEPVVIVGPHPQADEVSKLLRDHPKIGLRPTVACPASACRAVLGRYTDHLITNTGGNESCAHCPAPTARVALVIYSDRNEIEAIRDKYRDIYQRVILLHSKDRGLNLSSVTVREFGGLIGLEIRQNLLDRWAQLEKRLIDVVVSAVGIFVLAPFLALVALLIYLDSPGRIIYRQKRLGKGGKVFSLLKFRTMHLNADEVLKDYLARDPALKQKWDLYQKLDKDPRITRVGRLLRRFSIDELPQLWNVFIGEMSLVGPRPIMLSQQEMYGKAYEHYIRVRTGMTGLWQVSGRNKTTFARRAGFDVQYVYNWSIWLDVYILVRTLWVVLARDGAA